MRQSSEIAQIPQHHPKPPGWRGVTGRFGKFSPVTVVAPRRRDADASREPVSRAEKKSVLKTLSHAFRASVRVHWGSKSTSSQPRASVSLERRNLVLESSASFVSFSPGVTG